MDHLDQDRRQRRSDDPITALHYQLAHARYRGGFEALVLVDQAGMLVAGAGAWPVCEELAAFAPLLEEARLRGPCLPPELFRLRPEVRLQRLKIQGSTVLLAARGAGEETEESLTSAARGCLRILSSQAEFTA
ncbi:MAG: hypothetical protein MUF64_00520 [Polyangiaceae bacterium]|jgi:hypothetical protein|nr:hypothetical protein [Polyangiaceae bacterium]